MRSKDHLGGVGLNFTSEIIYLQPLDRSAAAGALVIYSPWSEERRRGNTFYFYFTEFYCVLCAVSPGWGFMTDNHPSFQ